ncbi:MAG: GAF domain-containing protein [Anaerolineae bacterium]|nr:MAG: GAF domain-containing protein [Anaerolineae bacterium]MCL4876023.1 GAF domain-containing protein [Anaerolineae bacterium]
MEQDTLERMLRVSREMAEIRVLDPLLEYTLREAIDFVDAERGYIILLEDDGSFNFRMKVSHDGTDIESPEDQVSTSIISKALFDREAVLTHDAVNDPKFGTASSVKDLHLRSVLCVPMISQGEVLGAIFLENRSFTGLFNQDDLTLLTLFGNQAAVNVANARLNDALEMRVQERTRELEEAQVQVERGWREAIELNRLQAILMGNIAHDLRSPLSVAVSAITFILEGAFGSVTPEQDEWLNNALKAINIVVRLTNDIFDMVKLEQGQITIEKKPVNLYPFLHEIYELGHGLSWVPGVSFQLEIPDELPIIKIDETRIHQVLFNLLSNSLKYTLEGSVTLFARWNPGDPEVLIGVRDTGEGIPEEMLERIFERFQQIEGNPVRQRQGAGLGLAICRELITMHEGKIWAESAPGQGTTLQFSLPVGTE